MSQWTHVCGCIRINSFELDDFSIETKLQKAFGGIWRYDRNGEHQRYLIPTGSEGPVQYSYAKTKCDYELAWGVVYIWGSLRDYNNIQAVYDWIKGACNYLSHPNCIRSCAVKVDVDYDQSYLICDQMDNQAKVHIVMHPISKTQTGDE